jgi:hypothetical protein
VLQSPTWLDRVTPERGRFRSWLLASLRHHLADERDRDRALKRGGGAPVVSLDALDAEARYLLGTRRPAQPGTALRPALGSDRAPRSPRPSCVRDYEPRWEIGLFEVSSRRFRAVQANWSVTTPWHPSLGMTEGAVKVAVHRLRQRYREIVRDLVAQTLESPGTGGSRTRTLDGRAQPFVAGM